jgi:hypothetical protein
MWKWVNKCITGFIKWVVGWGYFVPKILAILVAGTLFAVSIASLVEDAVEDAAKAADKSVTISGNSPHTPTQSLKETLRLSLLKGVKELHLGAVALELLLGFILVELIWHSHEKKETEKQKEEDKKKEHLRLIKNYMFHARMRTLFITNFLAMTRLPTSFSTMCDPKKEIPKPKTAEIQYKTRTAKISVIQEYVRVQDVWERFLELGIMFSINHIVKDMTNILQRVAEVKEIFPSGSIENMPPHEFAAQLGQDHNSYLIDRFEPIIKDGVVKFYDYAEDLRTSNQDLFNDLINFYSRAYDREQANQSKQQPIEHDPILFLSKLASLLRESITNPEESHVVLESANRIDQWTISKRMILASSILKDEISTEEVARTHGLPIMEIENFVTEIKSWGDKVLRETGNAPKNRLKQEHHEENTRKSSNMDLDHDTLLKALKLYHLARKTSVT